jgi:hypothetical protein
MLSPEKASHSEEPSLSEAKDTVLTAVMAIADHTAMVVLLTEKDAVEEEDIKKPSKPSLEKESQLVKANLNLPQNSNIQPINGKEP